MDVSDLTKEAFLPTWLLAVAEQNKGRVEA